MIDRMRDRQQVAVVVDGMKDIVGIIDEHLGGTEVVVGRIQADDEVARKEIVSQHLVLGVGIDEDVRERRGRVADVAPAVEKREQLADLPVYPGDLVPAMPDVDRGVIGLVIDEKHRLPDGRRAPLRAVCLQPLDQVPECARVLLDDEDHRLLQVLQGDADTVRDGLAEVPLRRRERTGLASGIEPSDSHDPLGGKCPSRGPGAVKTDEALVDPALGLVAQVIVDAGDDDDDLVSGVGGLAGQTDVVGCLP